MNGVPILSIMTWAPFVAALIVMFFARQRPLLVRWASLAGATVSLVASVWVFCQYDRQLAGFQFQEEFALVPSLGISYLFAVDGISALMGSPALAPTASTRSRKSASACRSRANASGRSRAGRCRSCGRPRNARPQRSSTAGALLNPQESWRW